MHSQRGNSSVGRARPCQGRGREFKSRFPLHKDDSKGHPFFCCRHGRAARQGWAARQGLGSAPEGSRFRHQEPSHNRSSTGIRLIFDRSLARHLCPQALQRHPRVTKGASGRSSPRPPCPQVPQWHPRVAKRSYERPSARRHCPQMSQLHPRVAKRSSDRASARRHCPQMPQWHPRVAKRHQTDA